MRETSINNSLTNNEKEPFMRRVHIFLDDLNGNVRVIAIHHEILNFSGNLRNAAFLSQLIYWTDKGGSSDGFIYKSDQEWADELNISKYAVEQARKDFIGIGILETKIGLANGAPTTHYRIDRVALMEAFHRYQENNIPITEW
jgi:hypothetical protein